MVHLLLNMHLGERVYLGLISIRYPLLVMMYSMLSLCFIVPCPAMEFKREKLTYARSSEATFGPLRGNVSKPNVEPSFPNASGKNIMVVDRHIRKIVVQTLGIIVDETSPIPAETNKGTNPHYTTSLSGLDNVSGEGSFPNWLP